MKKISKLIVSLLLISQLAYCQDSASNIFWFNKNPDSAAEALANKLEKLNLELISINDIEEYEFDKRGKKTKIIKNTKRILELPDNKLIQITYDTKNLIKSYAISSTDISDIASFTSLFGINKWVTVIEEPEMIMKTTNGYFSKFYIFNEKRKSGLETKSYSLFIEKEIQQNLFTKENVAPINLDSLTIYNNTIKLQSQLISLFESLGQKYLISEAEEAITNDVSGDLEYYSKKVLFKDGLNFTVFKKANNFLSEITISSKNPIQFLKLKREFISANMEQVEKAEDFTKYKYKNLVIMDRAKEKILDISILPFENDISGRLSNAPTLNFGQIMNIYESFKNKEEELEAYKSQNFLYKVNLDWKNKTLMPDLEYKYIPGYSYPFYFLSPNNKIVECKIVSKLTPNWTAPFFVNTEDTEYIASLQIDHPKSNYSTFSPIKAYVDNIKTVFQFRIHDPRKEEERKVNEIKEKQERQQQAEERAAYEAKRQELKYERATRGLNSLNSILNQIQQQSIKK
jgi:hypothetical protein